MFLVGDSPEWRDAKIRRYLRQEPSVAVLVAAAHFEWTVCRAVVFLSLTPNRELRRGMRDVYGLREYKRFWRDEVAAVRNGKTLPVVVRNWSAVAKAFEMRNRLVHGRDRATRNMALPHVDALLIAAANIRDYCSQLGVDFNCRLPVRRSSRRRSIERRQGETTAKQSA
jgi:hypothetical protein